jgi:hypothetical protein
MELSTISFPLSSGAPLWLVRLSRHAMRSLLREASALSILALVSRKIPAISQRALVLALMLRLNSVNGRFTGTAAIHDVLEPPASTSWSRLRLRPKSSRPMITR